MGQLVSVHVANRTRRGLKAIGWEHNAEPSFACSQSTCCWIRAICSGYIGRHSRLMQTHPTDQIIKWANKLENEKNGQTLIQAIKLIFSMFSSQSAAVLKGTFVPSVLKIWFLIAISASYCQ